MGDKFGRVPDFLPSSPPIGPVMLDASQHHVHLTLIAFAFLVSGVVLFCVANRWYKYLYNYNPPYLGDYREALAGHVERVAGRRMLAEARRREASVGDEDDSQLQEAMRRSREETMQMERASSSHDHANLPYSSSSSSFSSPEIHPASSSTSASPPGSPQESPGLHGHMLDIRGTPIRRWQF